MEDFAALFDRAVELSKVDTVVADKVVAVQTGRELKSLKSLLDQYLPFPERRHGRQKLDDLASFIGWTKRHADAGSVLFCKADRATPSLVSVIDYHKYAALAVDGTGALAPVPDSVDGLARWLSFSGHYPMTLDPRWLAWRGIDGKAMGQAEFAAFLEDHALDLCPFAPSVAAATDQLLALPSDVQDFLNLTGGKCGTPEEVVALAKGLDVAVDGKASGALRLQSGEHRVTFSESHSTSRDGVTVDVPAVFLVAVPVFALNPTLYRLPVRLRYRVKEGTTFWLPTLWRADETVDQAIRESAETARTETGLPLFYGSSPVNG